MTEDILFRLICGAVILIMAVYYLKRRRKIISMLFGSLTGLAALFLANKYGAFLGADLPLNPFNVCGSAILGVPFVAIMIIIKYI